MSSTILSILLITHGIISTLYEGDTIVNLPSDKGGKEGTKILRNLSKVTQLGSGRARVQTQAPLTLETVFL